MSVGERLWVGGTEDWKSLRDLFDEEFTFFTGLSVWGTPRRVTQLVVQTQQRPSLLRLRKTIFA